MPQRISLPRICIALGFPDAEALLAHARKEYDAGERFLEFRIDYLPSPEQGNAAIRKFLSRHPDCTILATCRRHQNHGRYNGSVEEQVRILEGAIEAGAKAVDVEIESAENCAERLAIAAFARLSAALLSQLWRHAAARTGAAQDDCAFRPTAIRWSPPRASLPTIAGCWPGARASQNADGSAGDGRDGFSDARAFDRAGRPLHLRGAERRREEPPPARYARSSCAICIAPKNSRATRAFME